MAFRAQRYCGLVRGRRDRPQFSLRSLLLIMSGVGVYIALAAAAVRNHGELLDVLMDSPALYAIAFLCPGVAGICMLVLNITYGRDGNVWSIGLLVAGIVFAAANFCVFVGTLVVDRSAIFDRTYLTSVVFVGPAAMFAMTIVIGFFRRLGWLGVLGLVTCIASIGFAHLWIIAAASASI